MQVRPVTIYQEKQYLKMKLSVECCPMGDFTEKVGERVTQFPSLCLR
jgi:hypothetical protein